jgi:uncharacterized membrane protein YgcG
MKRVLLALAAVVLIAATPQEVLPELDASGFYIEDGSSASEQVVSDAVSDGRSDGGRLYIVVLADEPPGGATTFSDSTLDLLDDDGYVVTVAPETVGFAGDGTFWTADEMNDAIDASLGGGSDDEVVQLFIGTLVGGSAGGGEAGSGGGVPILWLLLLGAGAIGVWFFFSQRNRAKQLAARMDKVKGIAQEKLDEVANDILEMEDEVSVSDNAEVKEHYQRASKMYSQAMEDNQRATSVAAMMDVSEELDLAIWELDCAEAILDGKPKPPKPEPPQPTAPPPAPPVPEGRGTDSAPPRVPGTVDQYDRRPQRQSTGSNDMLTMLMAMMAMGGMRGGRGGGFGGGFGGLGGRGGSSMGGGGRIRGGGRRG